MIVRILGFVFALLLTPIAVQAATYTYDWTAANLTDSNGNPPPGSSSSLSGFFTLELDTSDLTNKLNLSVIDASDFTNAGGTTLGASEIGYSVFFQNVGEQRISVGGLLNNAHEMVGLSDDFRLDFRVNWGAGVTPTVIGPFGFFPYTQVSANLPFYTGDLTVTLRDSTVIPLPATLPLLAGAVLLLFMARRRT